MKTLNNLTTSLRPVLLAAVPLILVACHNSETVATSEIELPTVERSVMAPEILADGSIQIHSNQLVQHIGTTGVYILSDDNQARFRMVKEGKKSAGKISINSGLTGKEKILQGPYDSIYDGSPVRLK